MLEQAILDRQRGAGQVCVERKREEEGKKEQQSLRPIQGLPSLNTVEVKTDDVEKVLVFHRDFLAIVKIACRNEEEQ